MIRFKEGAIKAANCHFHIEKIISFLSGTETELTGSDRQNDDYMGWSVAMSDDGATVAIGANAYPRYRYEGAVYVFRFNGTDWVEEQIISIGGREIEFGTSVGLNSDGTVLIIGSPYEDDGGSASGSAYVYNYSGGSWTQTAKLTAADPAADDRFGENVAISDNGLYVAIGAQVEDNENGLNAGSVYIFFNSGTWGEQQKLIASDGVAEAKFGSAVDFDTNGNRIVIGAMTDAGLGSQAGKAYVFSRSGTIWTEEDILTGIDTAAGDEFGVDVAINGVGDVVAVGAHKDDDNGSGSGSAYVFTRSGAIWSQAQKITPADGAASDGFGEELDLSSNGSKLAISARERGVAGTVYTFENDSGTWSQLSITEPSDGASGDAFGKSVEMDSTGNKMVVGAPYTDSFSGSSYIFIAG